MLRKLLACLALLTGLAAAGAPAQAEMAVAVASQVEASASGASAARGAQVAACPRPLAGQRFKELRVGEPALEALSAAPTVYLGSDRSRE